MSDCPAGGTCGHDEMCNTRGCLRLDPPLIGGAPHGGLPALSLADRCLIHADKMDGEGWYVTASVLRLAADAIQAPPPPPPPPPPPRK